MTCKYQINTASYLLYKGRTHSYQKVIRAALFCCALLFTPLAFSADISGIWKHAKQPVWIEIRLQEGVGLVFRNDKFPDRVGTQILKEIKVGKSEQGLWHGRMYIKKLDEYKSVEISLAEVDRMMLTGKVGFLSRTVEWVRDDQ